MNRNRFKMSLMNVNRNGLSGLDRLVAAEVRAEIARSPEASVKGIAEKLNMRRATLSARTNEHVAFSPSLLSSVAAQLGTTASAIIERAEQAEARQARSPRHEGMKAAA